MMVGIGKILRAVSGRDAGPDERGVVVQRANRAAAANRLPVEESAAVGVRRRGLGPSGVRTLHGDVAVGVRGGEAPRRGRNAAALARLPHRVGPSAGSG